MQCQSPLSQGAVPRKIPPMPLFLPSVWLRLGDDGVSCLWDKQLEGWQHPSGVAWECPLILEWQSYSSPGAQSALGRGCDSPIPKILVVLIVH